MPHTTEGRLRGSRNGNKVRSQKAARRRERIGEAVSVCVKIPRAHLERITEAAERDHRTASNFVWHAAVSAADAILAK